MYCPKCNLHSEEYVDKCPLCDGPMEVDEVASGIMKTPLIPEEGSTEELPLGDTVKLEEDLEDDKAAGFDQEVLDDELSDSETLEEVEDLDAYQSSEFDSPLEDAADEPEIPPDIPFEPEESGGNRKAVFFGLIVIIILLAGAYYYFGYVPQSVKKTEKQEKRIAAPEKPSSVTTAARIEKKAAEEALTPKAPEPAGVPIKTVVDPSAEDAIEPPETKPDKMRPAEKTTVKVKEHPEPEKPLPDGSPELTAQTGPAISSSKPALSALTPAELALADAKKALEKEPLPAPSPDGRYLVSVSSFKEESRAIALKDKLVQSGYPAATAMVELPEKGTWFRVVVGGYANSKEAGAVSERIKAEKNLDPWIIKK